MSESKVKFPTKDTAFPITASPKELPPGYCIVDTMDDMITVYKLIDGTQDNILRGMLLVYFDIKENEILAVYECPTLRLYPEVMLTKIF